MASEILLKGMVCERCIAVIKKGFTDLGLELAAISLGKLSLRSELHKEDLEKVKAFLTDNGFELISNRQIRIVNRARSIDMNAA